MACETIHKLGPTYHWYHAPPLKLSTAKTEVKSFVIPNLLVPPSLFSILVNRITVCECAFRSSYSSAKSNIYFLMFLCLCPHRSFYLLYLSFMSPLKQHLLWDSFLLIWMESHGPMSMSFQSPTLNLALYLSQSTMPAALSRPSARPSATWKQTLCFNSSLPLQYLTQCLTHKGQLNSTIDGKNKNRSADQKARLKEGDSRRWEKSWFTADKWQRSRWRWRD